MSADSIRDLFSAQAERTPEATAVRTGQSQLTYRELDERSDRLAHRLLGLGVGKDAPVAVLMERSIDLVVAILAVVKTGAPYLPLHDSHPVAHTQWIIDDVGASVLLTDAATRAAALPEVTVTVAVDDLPAATPGPLTAPAPDDVACVIVRSISASSA